MTILILHQAVPPYFTTKLHPYLHPQVTGLIKTKKCSFSEMLRRELYLWPLAKKLYHDWINTRWRHLMKIHENAPPRNEELVAPLIHVISFRAGEGYESRRKFSKRHRFHVTLSIYSPTTLFKLNNVAGLMMRSVPWNRFSVIFAKVWWLLITRHLITRRLITDIWSLDS